MKTSYAAGWGCFVPLLLVGGCVYTALFVNRDVRDRDDVIGKRTASDGKTVEELVLRTTYATRGPSPGPHGMGESRLAIAEKVLLKRGSQKEELVFLRDKWSDAKITGTALPVANSSIWVAHADSLFDSGWVIKELRLVIFDDTHVIRHRSLGCSCARRRGDPCPEYHNGNRTVVYMTEGGALEAYDVIDDTVVPWKGK